jgi:hypothetical protein
MLRSAISASGRVFDALWRCAADPEPTSQVSIWVPALRSNATGRCCASPGERCTASGTRAAARRMGGAKRYPSIAFIEMMMGFPKCSTHPTGYFAWGCFRYFSWEREPRLNDPTGKSPKVCPAPFAKIFRFPRRANHLYRFAPSHPTRGAYHDRHETRGGVRWTRQRFARDGIAGRVERLVSDHQASGRGMLQRTAKSCGPDASTPASSPAEARSAQPGADQPYPRDDGDKKARSPGSTK